MFVFFQNLRTAISCFPADSDGVYRQRVKFLTNLKRLLRKQQITLEVIF